MVSIPSYNTHIATYDPIATQTLSSTATSVTFSSIAADWTDLLLVVNAKTARTNNDGDNTWIRFNGDSGNNYSWTRLYGTSSALSQRVTNATLIEINSTAGNAALGSAASYCAIQSYANTNVYKTVLLWGGNVSVSLERLVALWRDTSVITSIEIIPQTAPWQVGSKFSLYGIRGEL